MTDPRSIAALDVAERFANGAATEAELEEARRGGAYDAGYAAAAACAANAAYDAHSAVYYGSADRETQTEILKSLLDSGEVLKTQSL
jgi:hypothetical protein